MGQQTQAKRERVIEAVRHGLEGDAAIEFIHESGYAINSAGIARHLRRMGGRQHVLDLIEQGMSNVDILEACFPEEDFADMRTAPSQAELFTETPYTDTRHTPVSNDEFETTSINLRIPTDLHHAIRLAAKAEGKSQHQLVTDILTHALGNMPMPSPDDAA